MLPRSKSAPRFSLGSPRQHPSLHLVHPCDVCAVRPYSACSTLDADDQERLVAIMKTVEIEAHQSIFHEAEKADYVFNVTEGAVKIYKLLSDGRRQITGFLFPGDFLGLTHNESYAYGAEALGPTKLCRFPRQKLEALLDELPNLEQRLLSMASHELAAAQDQMILLGRKSARERVVSFLLMLSNSAVRHGRSGNPVSLPMTRHDMGDYLGLSLETVSRALTQLKTHGFIQLLDERQVRLIKADEMRAIATGF
jgi:CRP/FNR family transcriptional regulator